MGSARHRILTAGSGVLIGTAALVAGAGCSPIAPIKEAVEDAFEAPTPHERYADLLSTTGLDRTAMGREWNAASRRSLREAAEVDVPYRGVGYLAAESPSAAGYGIALRRGERLEVEVEWQKEEDGAVFMDLFRVHSEHLAASEFRHVASADTTARFLSLEVPHDGVYILRLQTELLRSASYSLTLRTAPTLSFPVHGHDHRAIRSAFGVPRDGGRRAHHGVDIFAPRGTPVLAATEGRVARVGTNRLGGNVIWLRDEGRGLSLYYAHLDRHLVRGGERVAPGDTLGLVGNTGNARTTPPHLHFGVYRRGEGALDPMPFIRFRPTAASAPSADLSALGRWLRTVGRSNLRETPGTGRPPLETLEGHAPLRATGATGEWYRVTLPDGRSGFVSARLVEPTHPPVAERSLKEARPLLDRPAAGALVMDTVVAGSHLPVLAAWRDYLLISSGDVHGWVLSAAD